MSRETQLNETFVELADTLVNHFDVADILHTLAVRCVDLFDIDAAGLMLADQTGTLRVVGSSCEQARMLELLEVQNEEGPCLDCYRAGTPVEAEDLGSGGSWPDFSRGALAAGFHSVLALPMRLRDDVIGALNLFRLPPGRLNKADRSACQALADVATISLLQERAAQEVRILAEQLQVALNNRVIIEQAKGVLAERADMDMDAAFQLLRGHARRNNLRLPDVAQAVIEEQLAVADLRPADR
jgi:transcriptional regulator with GAF, ATPase, and Fis domain